MMLSFPDGLVKEYSYNSMSENVLTRVDSYVFSVTLLEAIKYHHKDNADVDVDDKYVITLRGGKGYE